MSNTRYSLYLSDTIKLAKTLVIKSEETVELFNDYVKGFFGTSYFDESNKKSWKYYMNIAGQYHPTDTPMEVVSWDTLETIVFNQENLAIHRATYRAFAYDTDQYKQLVAKYPEQVLLIKGILYPVDIQTAIDADDGTVLNWDSSLVEENEYDLISKIEAWVKSFKTRWFNQQYMISDNLYVTNVLGVMYIQLLPAILSFRLEACKTNQAHSYHMNEYLLSHGIPEISVQHLTKKQKLYFYRNINYIQRNAGKQSTFDLLVQHIMTERGLPLSKFTMKHQDTNQVENLYPEILFKSIPLNTSYNTAEDYITLPQALSKEEQLAPGNSLEISYTADKIREQFENAVSSVIDTKMLESTVIDYTDAGEDRVDNILMNHWIYYATHDRFNIYIGVTNPKTGERIPIIVKDALALAYYALTKSMGIELVYVPEIVAKKVLKSTPPTISQMMALVDKKYVDQQLAVDILADYPSVPLKFTSTEHFNHVVTDIFKYINLLRKVPPMFMHMDTRGYVENMCLVPFFDMVCRLAPEGTTYVNWLADHSLDFSSYNETDFYNLYVLLVQEATGIALEKEPTLESIQRSMLLMLQTLSSYSLQYIRQINSDGMIDLRKIAVRLGDMDIENENEIDIYGHKTTLQELNLEPLFTINTDNGQYRHGEIADYQAPLEFSYDPTTSLSFVNDPDSNHALTGVKSPINLMSIKITGY